MTTRFALSAIALATSTLSLSAHAAADTYALDDIVVTATRTPLPAKQVIGDITVITPEQIRNAGQTTLVELLQGHPDWKLHNQAESALSPGCRFGVLTAIRHWY